MNYSESLLKEYKNFMVLKNFSPRTITTYLQIVKYFLNYFETNHPGIPLSDSLVQQYLLIRFDQGWSWQTINSDYSSIQKFFKNVLFLDWSLRKLPRPRKQKILPTIFSKEVVVKIIEAATSFKQQMLLAFIYVTGARLSEAVHVKIDDIDSNRCQIRINQSNGGKDRFILVPKMFIDQLRVYIKQFRPQIFLFNGNIKGKPYAPRTLQYTLLCPR